MTYPLVISRNIGALSEVSKHLNVLRQVFDRVLPLSFGGPGKKKHETQWQKEFHAGNAIKPEVISKQRQIKRDGHRS
jgi:hypothetical protein